LLGLAALALEVSTRPRLLPLFVAILKLVPGTVRELQQTERRLAVWSKNSICLNPIMVAG
jgi:hypothetical protein